MNKALAALLLLVATAAAPQAMAEEPKQIGTFGDWDAVTFTEGGNTGCYLYNEPAKMEGKYKTRGKSYLLVTHRPAAQSLNVVMIKAGYSYKKESEVTVDVGGETFKLFTENDSAWARDAATDTRLVEAMKKANRMVVKGTSSRGTETTDTYSLQGFSAAHKAIGQACNVPTS